MKKKQTKADKAFIAKIATVGIKTGKSGSHDNTCACPSCGIPMNKLASYTEKGLTAEVYAHVPMPGSPDSSEEQSFSA